MKKYLFASIFFYILFFTYTQGQQLVTLQVPIGGACGMCKDRIEETLLSAGATTAIWDEDKLLATISLDTNTVNVDDLLNAVSAVGHDAPNYPAPDEVYSQLPECCLYNRLKNEKINLRLVNENGTPLSFSTIKVGDFLSITADSNGIVSLPTTSPSGEPIGKIWVSTFETGLDSLVVNPDWRNHKVQLSQKHKMLKTFVFSDNRLGIMQSKLGVGQLLTRADLQKAPCCNIAESFETNASVDATTTDAGTGLKTIRLLGIEGTYAQYLTDGMPMTRGGYGQFALEHLPGLWVQSIEISKGSGPVSEGFESITGALRFNLASANIGPKFAYYGFANQYGRTENQLVARFNISENIEANIMLANRHQNQHIDRNGDSFADLPLVNSYAASANFTTQKPKYMLKWGINAVTDTREGGQKSSPNTNYWQSRYQIDRWGGYFRAGLSTANNQFDGWVLAANANTTNAKQFWGLNRNWNLNEVVQTTHIYYQTKQLLYNSEFKFGVSDLGVFGTQKFDTSNILNNYLIPGAFAEWLFKPSDKFYIQAGTRADYALNNLMPIGRLHTKYQINNRASLRASVGNGFRVANPIADNLGLLGNNRYVLLPTEIKVEKGMNMGFGFEQEFHNKQRPILTLAFDYFYTKFNQQLSPFMEHPGVLLFEYLNNVRAHHAQLEARLQVTEQLLLNAAVKHQIVYQDFEEKTIEKMMLPNWVGFINTEYNLGKGYKADATMQLLGSARMPEHGTQPQRTPTFAIFNAHISKEIKMWRLSFGVENLFDYRQPTVVNFANQPDNIDFETSMIWAPIVGRTLYVGVNYTLQ